MKFGYLILFFLSFLTITAFSQTIKAGEGFRTVFPSDFVPDCSWNNEDVYSFVTDFKNKKSKADLDNNDVFDIDDVITFLNDFSTQVEEYGYLPSQGYGNNGVTNIYPTYLGEVDVDYCACVFKGGFTYLGGFKPTMYDPSSIPSVYSFQSFYDAFENRIIDNNGCHIAYIYQTERQSSVTTSPDLIKYAAVKSNQRILENLKNL